VAPEPARTGVHAFDLTDRTGARYVGSATVAGYVVPGVGMSAHRGRLRVLTTDNGRQESSTVRRNPGAHLYVLAERRGRLRVAGEAAGFEGVRRVMTMHWLGDRAVLVTMRPRIGSLDFTQRLVDLAAPERPRLREAVRLGFEHLWILENLGSGRALSFGPGRRGARGTTVALTHDLRGDGTVTRRGRLDLGVQGAGEPLAYLSGRQIVVFKGNDVNRAPAGRCPGRARDTLNRRDLRPGDDFRLRCPFADVSVAFAVRVAADGGLRLVGRYTNSGGFRALLPVAGRIVAVTSDSLVVLDPDGLRPLGSVRLTPDAE
jgi:hypothetical protein